MAAPSTRPIVVLVGPTAVGKTDAALHLCRRIGGEIIGADSVQVYRGFDIGAAKPRPSDLGGVAHHLIDVLDPSEEIDAARFAALADTAIAAVRQRGATPVIVGGTGLWLRALLRGLVALPAVDTELRRGLEREFEAVGGDVMHARLVRVDPESAAQIHPHDMIRVVRALEVHAQTGQALGALRRAHALGRPRYRALTIALDLAREAWLEIVSARARSMIESGLVDEVRGLVACHGPDIKPLRAVGYRQVVEGLSLGMPEAEMERQIVRATRLYGKRQRTWFQSDPSVDMRAMGPGLAAPAIDAIERHLALVR